MGSIPPKTKITTLKTEVDELKNPTDRPPPGTPREAVQVIDRQRLLAAWESNVKTLRGVIEQMEIAHRIHTTTRLVSFIVLICNLVLLFSMLTQLEQMERTVKVIQTSVEEHRKMEPVGRP